MDSHEDGAVVDYKIYFKKCLLRLHDSRLKFGAIYPPRITERKTLTVIYKCLACRLSFASTKMVWGHVPWKILTTIHNYSQWYSKHTKISSWSWLKNTCTHWFSVACMYFDLTKQACRKNRLPAWQFNLPLCIMHMLVESSELIVFNVRKPYLFYFIIFIFNLDSLIFFLTLNIVFIKWLSKTNCSNIVWLHYDMIQYTVDIMWVYFKHNYLD